MIYKICTQWNVYSKWNHCLYVWTIQKTLMFICQQKKRRRMFCVKFGELAVIWFVVLSQSDNSCSSSINVNSCRAWEYNNSCVFCRIEKQLNKTYEIKKKYPNLKKMFWKLFRMRAAWYWPWKLPIGQTQVFEHFCFAFAQTSESYWNLLFLLSTNKLVSR